MKREFIVLGLLLLLIAPVFALSQNSMQHFNLSWNPNTNQLNVGIQCKGQAIAHIVLSNQMEKDVICPTMDMGQTWLLGDQTDVTQLTGTATIPAPCDTCSRTATINIQSAANQEDNFWLQASVLGLIGVVCVVFLFVINMLRG